MNPVDEELPEDYNSLEFPIFNSSDLIEYRVKINLKCSQVFFPGEEKMIPTRLVISIIPEHVTFHIKEESRIPLMMLSEGPISPAFRGRLFTKLVNVKNDIINLNADMTIGYLIIQLNV